MFIPFYHNFENQADSLIYLILILQYAIERNFGSNLFSLYDPFDPDPIFQIDANLGYPGAVMVSQIHAFCS